MKQKRVIVILLLTIVLIATSHYLTPVHSHSMHAVFQRLFYIPIIIGALLFELWPGIIFALLTAILYLPHVLIQWDGMHNDIFTKSIEVAMMIIISFLTGLLARRIRKEHEKAQAAQKQVARMDRLALLGKLSAGLAHEIRNPLGSLVGSAEILEIELGKDHPQYPFVDILHKELKRLTDKLNQFLSFAKPSEPTIIENSLIELINSTVDLVSQDAKKQAVEIFITHQKDQPLFAMDSEQLRQIVLNLLLNAIQQLNHGGTIEVATFFNTNQFGFCIKDSGGGIDESIFPNLFEPFFTTKESGTGLGLAIAKEMVENMHGTITAENDNAGALFTVRINNDK